jgi:translocation and assembly module TamA
MKPAQAAAALQRAALAAAVVLASGCASLGGGGASGSGEGAGATAAAAAAPAASAASAPGAAFTLVTPQEFEQQSPTLGVVIEIEAPAPLKALLQRHLDLVRLGSISREDVEDSEWARLIDASPNQVRELLQTEGYFSPQVRIERETGRAVGQPDRVRLQVEPGQRARIGRVTLEVEGALASGSDSGEAHAADTLKSWRDAWPLDTGREFRNADWADAKAGALARLRAAGYATANWVGTGAAVDPVSNTVRLFLVADSGPLFRYGQLEIEGLVVHEAQTVQNLAGASRGTPVTESLVLDYQERLQKSGLFENVSVTLDPDPARADDARVLVRLREAPLQVYTVGVGISANTGPRATVEHTWRRVFGWAASSRNKVEWGQKRQFWEGEISTHPGERLYRNLIGATVSNEDFDADTVLSQRLRLGRTQDTQRIERLYYVEAERSVRTTLAGARTTALALSLNYDGVWRDLDSVVLPTQGFTFAGEAGVGRSRGSGARDGNFSRLYARITGYLPLGRTWYAQARLEAGEVFLDNNAVVPDSRKFRAGGDDSVRGYGYASLGPLVNGVVGGGNVMFTTSFELARPIVPTLPSLWGAVFVDAGNAGDNFKSLKPAVGLGVGVRWRSPVGPLRIDWAYGRETRQGRLHFSVGIAF